MFKKFKNHAQMLIWTILGAVTLTVFADAQKGTGTAVPARHKRTSS